MLRILLAKDLRRAWRNPLPWLINLIVPLAITALIGLVFGGGAGNGALGRIRFAVVDEDQSILSDMLRGAANQKQGGEHLEPVFLDRESALKQVNANKISAVLIIETNFMRNYLTAREPVSLELIKNPAESINPAVLEELLGVVVTALNAVSRNFHSDFPEWQLALEGKEDYHRISFLIEQAGDKLQSARRFIKPPLVSYEKPEADDETNKAATGVAKQGSDSKLATGQRPAAIEKKSVKPKNDNMSSLFAYLLLGLSAMFLLFLGQNAMTDLHRELRKRTFERFQTMHQQLWPFILGKIVFTVVILLICSTIMLGGGGLAFRIHWQNPLPLLALVASYGCFIAALFAVLVALMPDERRAGVINNIAAMGLGLAGGCMFPPRNLPQFCREHITPFMPSYWFVDTARDLQSGGGDVPWELALFKLVVCGVLLTALAAWLFRQKFKTGLRT